MSREREGLAVSLFHCTPNRMPLIHHGKYRLLLHYFGPLYFYQLIFPFCCLYLCIDAYCKAHLCPPAPNSPGTAHPKARGHQWWHRALGRTATREPSVTEASDQDILFLGLQVLCCPGVWSCFLMWGLVLQIQGDD